MPDTFWKVTVFKTLGISKAVYIAFLTTVPQEICDQLQKIQNDFLMITFPAIGNEKVEIGNTSEV